MANQKDGKKIIKFSRGVEQTTRSRDDGTIEVVPGSYTIHLESSGITTLFGVSLATARAYKRIADSGFTDIEIRRIQNNGPFSIDPDVDCSRLMLQFSAMDEIALQDSLGTLQTLLNNMDLPDDAIPEDDIDHTDNLLRLIRSLSKYIRMPKNLELAEELKQLKLCGKKGKDKKQISAIIGKIQARRIKKYPS